MEDLYEEDMPRDYEDCPELDGYDLDMVDDGEHEALGIEGRLAAEQALDDRDAQARRRRRRESSSPPPRNVRRRIECSPVPSEADGPEGDHDEAAPDEAYDLTHETFREDMSYIDKRLERKIQRNFQRFLCLFKQEGEREETYPDMLNKMAEDNLRHLEVSFGHLQTWSPPLAWLITEKPDLVLPLLNETLMGEAKRNFETYQCLAKRGENELRVAVHSFPVKEPIGKLVVKHKNKFICVSGVCTKRSKVGIQETAKAGGKTQGAKAGPLPEKSAAKVRKRNAKASAAKDLAALAKHILASCEEDFWKRTGLTFQESRSEYGTWRVLAGGGKKAIPVGRFMHKAKGNVETALRLAYNKAKQERRTLCDVQKQKGKHCSFKTAKQWETIRKSSRVIK